MRSAIQPGTSPLRILIVGGAGRGPESMLRGMTSLVSTLSFRRQNFLVSRLSGRAGYVGKRCRFERSLRRDPWRRTVRLFDADLLKSNRDSSGPGRSKGSPFPPETHSNWRHLLLIFEMLYPSPATTNTVPFLPTIIFSGQYKNPKAPAPQPGRRAAGGRCPPENSGIRARRGSRGGRVRQSSLARDERSMRSPGYRRK
jgi:hypothetical protein